MSGSHVSNSPAPLRMFPVCHFSENEFEMNLTLKAVHFGAWYSCVEQDQLSIEGRLTKYTDILFCSCDFDLDLMTFIYGH